MYTASLNDECMYSSRHTDWCIFDPDGDWICNVPNEYQALRLIGHLNRG